MEMEFSLAAWISIDIRRKYRKCWLFLLRIALNWLDLETFLRIGRENMRIGGDNGPVIARCPRSWLR